MKKILITSVILLISLCVVGQTLTETQMRNARATGYAIVASRNPGTDFSIYMIPWDGLNTLEYNANTQINSGWHAQAAVKGNYFYQEFNGSDFSTYSSVILSQEQFDIYKSTGTQWWIVCSTLPSFSENYNINSLHVAGSTTINGNVGLGTISPQGVLHLKYNSSGYDPLFFEDTRTGYERIWRIGHGVGGANGFGFYDQTAGIVPLFILDGGNVGIGTTNPGNYKLNVNGKIRADEVVVNTTGADFVFKPGYKLLSLSELEEFIKQNHHLPDIDPASEIRENGMNMSEMQTKLLQKVEEMTLYIIEQDKQIQALKEKIENMESSPKN